MTVTDAAQDPRLLQLKAELDEHARVARYLHLDFQRPVSSLADGYPENAVALVGKITERLLKQLWIHHSVPGSPIGRTLRDLISACRPWIRSQRVIDALQEIQRLRNRAAHDGYTVADEDALTAIRRLLDVLTWYTSTGSGALSRHAPRLAADAAARAEFLAGLYVTMDYKLARRRELSRHAVYLLFTRERGLRAEHVELLLSRDTAEAAELLNSAAELPQPGLPQLTRLLVTEHDDGTQHALPQGGWKIVAYDHFIDVFVDVKRHLAAVAAAYPPLDAATETVLGDILTTDAQSGEMKVRSAGPVHDLLSQLATSGGNLLIVGPPGSGKTTLLKQVITTAPSGAASRPYRFFFDLSLKGRQESFADFVTRTLAPCMAVETAYVFPAFCYLTRSGSVLCAIDGFDEAVPEMTLPGLLSLFAEVTQVLSAESAAVLATRVSFLEDSPQARRLLDGTSLMPEKLAQQLHARGVDPQRMPRFSVVRLHGDPAGGSLLTAQIQRQMAGQRPGASEGGTGTFTPPELADLLWRYVGSIAGPDLLPRLTDYLGLAFLRGQTVFTLIDLVNGLGAGAFAGGHIDASGFTLSGLFRTADPDGQTLAMRHTCYQEILAGEFLRTAGHRDAALAAGSRPRLTEEVRSFLHQRSRAQTAGVTITTRDDCVVPAGVYLVGPSHELMLRRITTPVQLDRFPVTVSRYKAFLDKAGRTGTAQWDHPATPAGHSHQPCPDKLPVPDYYTNPAYDSYPAVAISWWSAYAFARADGKRLPSSLEWEAAARGFDGRLFPWGDEVDISITNCADAWSGHPLITYDAWKAARADGGLADALPDPVDAHPGNASPFGIRELGGNVWEWTSTVLNDFDEAVICGGSFDNPYRAVQASSKGTLHRPAASETVGFRCTQDMP